LSINTFFRIEKKSPDFHYAWFLATLVVSELPDNGSFPLCWDNVIYGSKGWGTSTINTNGTANQSKKVITYYSFQLLKLRKTVDYCTPKRKLLETNSS
jgi:hypothetical protein